MLLVVNNPPANGKDIRDTGLIPGLGRSPGEGNGNLPWYSCLENSMDRGAWWAIVDRATKSWTQLSMHAHGAWVALPLKPLIFPLQQISSSLLSFSCSKHIRKEFPPRFEIPTLYSWNPELYFWSRNLAIRLQGLFSVIFPFLINFLFKRFATLIPHDSNHWPQLFGSAYITQAKSESPLWDFWSSG